MLPVVHATRYVTPLREGGSLPGLVEADDLGIYVMKFRGAGQGRRALVAEVIVGELARRVGIATPELRAIELDAAIARYEADEEVQDLLNASVGLNLGVDFLPGAFGYDVRSRIDPDLAARILWLDSLTANVDRSWRNPNLLLWHGRVWAIDHGAALYFHHSWTTRLSSARAFSIQPYDTSDHVLRQYAAQARVLHEELSAIVTTDLLSDVVGQVPDDWLETVGDAAATTQQVRSAYVSFLESRIAMADSWLPKDAAA